MEAAADKLEAIESTAVEAGLPEVLRREAPIATCPSLCSRNNTHYIYRPISLSTLRERAARATSCRTLYALANAFTGPAIGPPVINVACSPCLHQQL